MDPFRSVPVLSKGTGLWIPAFISHWSEAAWAEYGHSKFLAFVGTGKENQAKGLKGTSLTYCRTGSPEEDLSVLGIKGLEEVLSRQKVNMYHWFCHSATDQDKNKQTTGGK